MSRARMAGGAGAGEPLRVLREYVRLSELPLTCLVFIVPLMIAYEVGTVYYASDPIHHTEQRIIAFTMMRRFFEMFGATGRYMPAMAVGSILVAWHLARKDPWQVDVPTVLGMTAESMLLGLPLLVLCNVVHRYLPLNNSEMRGLLVSSVGAGIYEELVFRLIAFTLLHILLIDVFEINRVWASLLIVLTAAVLFSLYHYLGKEQFAWDTCIFRTLAGVYFGVIFLTRGFGITVGAHAAYDVVAVLLTSAAVR